MKALSLLALMLLVGAASAWRPEHDHKPPPTHPLVSRDVLRCIRHHDCLSDGWHAVCASNKALNVTGAFPNMCYLRCANREKGVSWEPVFRYRTSRYCIKNWTRDPLTCSTCPVFEDKPQHRPEHPDRPHGRPEEWRH